LLGYNIKTGLGGIREIEFFVQTQQLISGGKNKMLRQRSTLEALGQLTDFNWVAAGVCEKLAESYEKLRFLEHILQLIDDAQTHSIPNDYNKVDTDVFLNHLLGMLNEVNDIVTGLYSRLELELDQPQFRANKSQVDEILIPYVNKWLTYNVLRSERSLVLFEGLQSLIVARVLITETPRNTLFHFDNFLKSLSFGVQVFSLFKANPAVLELLIDICGAAPALAEYLERNPAVLDAVTDRSFFSLLPSKKELGIQLKSKVIEAEDYEGVLDAARIFVKENQFMTGVHLLKAFSSITEVSQSFSNIADVCLVILFDAVEKKFVQRYGRVPGLGVSILAMGKLGSKEMSIGSDLDLIIIYDVETGSVSNGKIQFPAQVYF
jgi:glutamate-ammonia-ligase adenylyltransferase